MGPIPSSAVFVSTLLAQVEKLDHTVRSHFMHLPAGSNWKMRDFVGSYTVCWQGIHYALRFEIQDQFEHPESERAIVFGRRLASPERKCPNSPRATLCDANFDATYGYYVRPQLKESQRNALAARFSYSSHLPYFAAGKLYLGDAADHQLIVNFLTVVDAVEDVKAAPKT